MALSLYRRHTKSCRFEEHDRAASRCDCNFWVEGTLEGVFVRESTKTPDRGRAQELVRQAERAGRWGPKPVQAMSTAAAVDFWIAESVARNLKARTVRKLGSFGRQIKQFGVEELADWTAEAARRFRSSWECSPAVVTKKIETLAAFFRFCQRRGWMSDNPAEVLAAPEVRRASPRRRRRSSARAAKNQ